MMAGAGTASAAHTQANARATSRAALERLLAHWHPTMHALHAVDGHASVRTGLKQVTAGNWSGYADDNSKGNKYSSITGKWAEPKVTCKASQQAITVFWVGLDGFGDQTVEQDGTLAFCPGGGTSTPQYYSWWEMFPTNAIQLKGSSVAPGDQISASVVKTGTNYALKVTDSTHSANSFSTTQSCSASTCLDESAEWIAEAPSGSSGQFPLANFHTWTLKSATVTSANAGTIKTFPDDEITMKISGTVLAKPGPLNSAGNQFKDTWKAST